MTDKEFLTALTALGGVLTILALFIIFDDDEPETEPELLRVECSSGHTTPWATKTVRRVDDILLYKVNKHDAVYTMKKGEECKAVVYE